jgi:hypothetical protein
VIFSALRDALNWLKRFKAGRNLVAQAQFQISVEVYLFRRANMKTQYLFCSVPYNLSDLSLGSFVADPRYPTQDALSVITAKKDVDYSVRNQEDFDGLLGSGSTSSFKAQVTRLLNLSRSKTTRSSLHLTAKAGSLYELKSPKTFFKLACAEPKARKWLQEGLEQAESSFFIVGLRTFRDASVGQSGRQSESLKGDATVPVGDAVKSNTGVSTGDALDVKVEGGKTDDRGSRECFKTEGEKVYAICYRKVKLSTRSVSDAMLGKDNVWKLYSDQREGGITAPIQEVCEAELEDFDFAVDGSLSPNVEHSLDADDTQFFVDKDIRDSE